MKRKEAIFSTMPFLMLLATLLSAFAYHYGYEQYLRVYERYLPDLVGYSVMTNVVFMYIYFRSRFCLATKVCVVSLLLMNIYAIAFKGTHIYSPLFDIIVGLFCIAVSIFLTLKRI